MSVSKEVKINNFIEYIPLMLAFLFSLLDIATWEGSRCSIGWRVVFGWRVVWDFRVIGEARDGSSTSVILIGVGTGIPEECGRVSGWFWGDPESMGESWVSIKPSWAVFSASNLYTALWEVRYATWQLIMIELLTLTGPVHSEWILSLHRCQVLALESKV